MINFLQLSLEIFKTYGLKILWILIIFFGGRWLIRVWLKKIIKVNRRLIKKSRNSDVARRSKTVESIIGLLLKITLYSLTIIMVLDLFNVKIGALLAGMGIIGLVVGLGTQHLLQNIFAGFFILVDDQFDIGDIIEVNGIRGKVIKLSLYSTALMGSKKEIIYLPNGSIKQVKNFSQEADKISKVASKGSSSH